MEIVYVVQHSYEVGDKGEFEGEDFDETKMIGVYSSKEKAEKTIDRYKMLPGFKDYPISCFHIDKYEIDQEHWAEGFVKFAEVVYPLWAEGNIPYSGESAKAFAKRLMDEKYGEGNYETGPDLEYNKIKKWGYNLKKTR